MNVHRRHLAAALVALAAMALGASCQAPKLRILAPADGSEVVHAPLHLELDLAPGADLESLEVFLNGVDVSDLFAFETLPSGRILASAEGVWEPGLVLLGANALEASVAFGTTGVTRTALFETGGDPFADEVIAFSPGSGAGFGQAQLPDVVLGPPEGGGLFTGSLDVLSLGFGGSVVLGFVDEVVVDGPGADLSVFENAFLRVPSQTTDAPFAEPARVSVSQDGVVWHSFACDLVVPQPPYYPGCAGVYPVLSDGSDPLAPHASLPTTTPIQALVGQSILSYAWHPAGSGGDSFDLGALGLAWARYVLLEAAPYATGPVGPQNAGFDLDAVAAVHSIPDIDLDADGVPDALE